MTGKKEDLKKAVALRYDTARENAPRVVASGKGYLAEKILQTAGEAGVPVYEDSALVEMLSVLDLSSEIPVELYRVVAEILVFVYFVDKQQTLSLQR